jgi:hypothetical protein
MKRIFAALAFCFVLTSTASADFQVVTRPSELVGHDISSIYGKASDGLEMGWTAPGVRPRLQRDEKLMFIVAPAEKFICDAAIGDRVDLYWTYVDANGDESDDHVLPLTVANERRLLRGSGLVDGTERAKLIELFDAMQSRKAIRFYFDEDCSEEGYSEVSTAGFVKSLVEFNDR